MIFILKKQTLIFIIVTCSFLYYSKSAEPSPRFAESSDHTIMVSAKIIKEPSYKILLNWKKNELSLDYKIYRKLKKDKSFTSKPIVILDSSAVSYLDSNVISGKEYEYQITSLRYASFLYMNYKEQWDSVGRLYFVAYDYIDVASELPPVDNYGKALLLVDSTIAKSLPDEIEQYQNTLIAEGWSLVRRDVPRTEKFDGKAVKNIKKIIMDEYNLDPTHLNTVILLGRVAVPYSGILNPDGHPEHLGAWPADVYYGNLNEEYWTDDKININLPGMRDENVNIPGDGKFDRSIFKEGEATLAVGRIDFYNMPVFIETEVELIRRYIKKNLAYRTGETKPLYKGTISDYYFTCRIYHEGLASTGWRSFSTLLGSDNVKLQDWIYSLTTDSYLWAYGCGPGAYSSASGLGTVDDYASREYHGIFTMMFGSYFGDWDSENNFLRAPLCSKGDILTCCWAGVPPWYFHHMTYGRPIGYSTMISQNNSTTFVPNAYYDGGYSPTATPKPDVAGLNMIHISLMGDPTLRMYMGDAAPPPPKNLQVIQTSGKTENLNWENQVIEGDYYFNIFRSDNPNGPFNRINQLPIRDDNYTDTTSYEGTLYYMVKTVQLKVTNCGSFYNSSIGTVKDILLTGIGNIIDLVNSVSCLPNPASESINLSLSLSHDANTIIEIYDVNSIKIRQILSTHLISGTHQLTWNLRDANNMRVSQGVYFIKIQTNDKVQVQKIIVFYF
jgi:hypothetical protein